MEDFNLLEGWHGTTPQNAASILTSKHVNVRPFSIKSDWNIPQGQSFPSDLGQGLYLFLDNGDFDFNGLECAKKYATVFRHYNHSVSTINFSFNENNLICLDLNEEENRSKFIKLRPKIYQKINSQLGVFKNSGALQRANLDGIIIEYLIQNHYKNSVGFVIKDTYTPFYNASRTLSNFPNGRELCLRAIDTIDWSSTKEVE